MDNAIRREPGNLAAKGSNSYSTLVEIPAVLKRTCSKPAGKVGTSAYVRFRKDPYYLLKYYFANIAGLTAASALIAVSFSRLDDFHYLA